MVVPRSEGSFSHAHAREDGEIFLLPPFEVGRSECGRRLLLVPPPSFAATLVPSSAVSVSVPFGGKARSIAAQHRPTDRPAEEEDRTDGRSERSRSCCSTLHVIPSLCLTRLSFPQLISRAESLKIVRYQVDEMSLQMSRVHCPPSL